MEFICHLIMNLCPGCFTWDVQKLDCTYNFPSANCNWKYSCIRLGDPRPLFDAEEHVITYWFTSSDMLKVLGLTPTGDNEQELINEYTGLFRLIPAQTSPAEVAQGDSRSPEEVEREHQASTAARFTVRLHRLRKKHTRKFLGAWL